MSPRARAALAYLAIFGGLGAFFPYSPLYYLERGLSYADIGVVFSVGSLIGIGAGPAWGAVSDRFGGSPRIFLVTCLVAAVGAALLAKATSFPTVLAANAVLALGWAGLMPIIDARAVEAAGADRAGYGPLRAWGSIGWVASSLLSGLAIERLGLGFMFVALGVGTLATAILGLGLRPATKVRAERPFRAAAAIFRAPALLLFLFGMFLANGAMAAVLDFAAPRYRELGAATWIVGLSSALAAAVEVPFMLRFPGLARRVGGARLLVIGVVILAIRSGLSAVAADPWSLVAAQGIGGIGYAFFFVGGVAYVAERVPPHLAATGQGVFQAIAFGLSGVVSAAGAGFVAGAIGIVGMFSIATAIGLVAAALVALAVLRRPSPP